MEMYSKRYEMSVVPPDMAKQEKTLAEAEKFVKNLYKEISERPLREREGYLKDCLKFIKDFTERFKIDVDIIQTEVDIQANLACRFILGWVGSMKDDLCILLRLCDEMNIEMDKDGKYDYIIVLKFFTHAIYKGNRKVFPLE